MNHTSAFEEFIKRSRTALSKKKKSTDSRGLIAKQNYSRFWMEDDWNTESKFGGISGASQTGDIMKAIKLTNYQRAVANFVKIVTKKDIPVKFHGSTSYTSGKSITISTDIKDNTFDVTVGLALHEASHCVLTDYDILTDLYRGDLVVVEDALIEVLSLNTDMNMGKLFMRGQIKELLNWVEDRRIDNYIFTTSPGYKAYYHKMYDYYWNSNDIVKGFLSAGFRENKYESYLFHIINSISPNYNPAALPGLQEITDIIDVRNIARLQSTTEALNVACAVWVKIHTMLAANVLPALSKQQQRPEDAGNTQLSSGAPEGFDDSQDSPESVPPSETLDANTRRAIEKAFQEQRNFLSGESNKKESTKKLAKQLEQAADMDVEIQSVGGTDRITNRNSMLLDCTDGAINKLLTLYDEHKLSDDKGSIKINDAINKLGFLSEMFDNCTRENYELAITKGLEMGGLLGKRLQLHNEARVRVDNRLRSGKMDNRRLAHAGYGVENVFSQIHVDAYNKANLHISLDGSGSMSGTKWEATLQMTVALAKAAAYTQNINVQVSIRFTSCGQDTPTNIMVYDSRKNKVNHLVNVFKHFRPKSMTPEGLCFESMIKRNKLVPGTKDMHSYFLNISDGAPGCHAYSGEAAINHTKRQVDKLRNELNMQVLAFYIDGSTHNLAALTKQFNSNYTGAAFRTMYGKDAKVTDPTSAIQIAKDMNKKFLAK